MKKVTFLILFLISSIEIKAQNLNDFFKKSDLFFKTYVIADKVDYKTLKSNSKSLDDILQIAAEVDLNNESANNFKAFWVNAYNLIVIKGIVDKFPMESTIAVSGFFDKYAYKVAKQQVTLKDIEKNFLKATFKDPLLNFVLVCGAKGCPPLMDGAYLPDFLSVQLEQRAKKSINNNDFIKINDKTRVVEVSEIFDWYKEDFIDKEQKILAFINQYRQVKIDETYTVTYYKYDWSLNKLN